MIAGAVTEPGVGHAGNGVEMDECCRHYEDVENLVALELQATTKDIE